MFKNMLTVGLVSTIVVVGVTTAIAQTTVTTATPVPFTGLSINKLGTPNAPTAQGSSMCSGSGYTYAVTALDVARGSSPESTSSVSVSCTPSTTAQYIQVITPSVPGAASCNVFRTLPLLAAGYIGNVVCGGILLDTGQSGAMSPGVPSADQTGGINALGMVNAQAFNATGAGAGTEILNSGAPLGFCPSSSTSCIQPNAFFQQAPAAFTGTSVGITWPSALTATSVSQTPPLIGPFLFGPANGVNNNASAVTIGSLTNFSNPVLATAASTTFTTGDLVNGTNTGTGSNYDLTDSHIAVATCGSSPCIQTPLSWVIGAAATNTISNGNFAQIWNWAQGAASGQSAFTLGESSAATGTNLIELNVQTLSGSSSLPIQVTAGGTTNGWNMSTTGLWEPIGTTGALATGGSTHGVVVSEGSATALNTTAVGGTGSILTGNTSLDPTWLSGASAVNGLPYVLTSTPSGGVATAPLWTIQGVNYDPQSSTYSIGCPADRLGNVDFTGSSATTFTLPNPPSSTCAGSSFSVVVHNGGTALLTLAAMTATIDNIAGATGVPIMPGAARFVYSDNTNYHTVPVPTNTGGATTKTATYSAVVTDKGKLIVFNCSSACSYALPTTAFSADWWVDILTIGTTNATVSLPPGPFFNGGLLAPSPGAYRIQPIWTDGTNYFGDAPITVSAPITATVSSNSLNLGVSNATSSAAGVVELSGTATKAQSTSMTSSTTGDLVTVDAHANTVDSTISSTAPIFTTSVTSPTVNATTGYQLNGAAIQASTVLVSFCLGTVGLTSGTLVLAPAELAATANCSATTTAVEIPVPYKCTAEKLYAVAGTGGNNITNSGVTTLYHNNSGTALKCTIGTGTSCNDPTDTVTLNAGDTWSVRTTSSGGSETLANVRVALQCQ